MYFLRQLSRPAEQASPHRTAVLFISADFKPKTYTLLGCKSTIRMNGLRWKQNYGDVYTELTGVAVRYVGV